MSTQVYTTEQQAYTPGFHMAEDYVFKSERGLSKKVVEQIRKRFDDLRTHFDIIAEALRDNFNNLYDFVKAQAERTDKRFDDLHKEIRTMSMDLRATIKLSYDSLNRRVTRLEQRPKGSEKRRRH